MSLQFATKIDRICRRIAENKRFYVNMYNDIFLKQLIKKQRSLHCVLSLVFSSWINSFLFGVQYWCKRRFALFKKDFTIRLISIYYPALKLSEPYFFDFFLEKCLSLFLMRFLRMIAILYCQHFILIQFIHEFWTELCWAEDKAIFSFHRL